MPVVGGLNVHRAGRATSCELERLLADLDLGAVTRAGGAERLLEIGVCGSRALDAEAAVGPEDAVAVLRLGCGG